MIRLAASPALLATPIALLFLLGPSLPPKAAATPSEDPGPRYARGFDLERLEDATILRVYRGGSPGTAEARRDREKGARAATYLLVERGAPLPDSAPDEATVVRTPVRSAVTLSSTYLPAFLELDLTERIVGHDRAQWVYSSVIRRRMASGKIAELGSGGNLDSERLLSLDPDIVLAYDAGTAAENPYPELAALDVTVVTTAEFREHSPLGRSEWILFIAAFFDREEAAREVFASIEERYLELQARVDEEVAGGDDRRGGRAGALAERPSVFLNAPWGSSWAMPEGDNYSAVFLEHAGASYVFRERPGTGTIFFDFETVLAAASDAGYWLNPGQWESREAARAEDPRFRLFEAFRAGRVYNNDARTVSGGGNDYFESGYLRADIVLADLIAIFHPRLVPGHKLYYYRRLP